MMPVGSMPCHSSQVLHRLSPCGRVCSGFDSPEALLTFSLQTETLYVER